MSVASDKWMSMVASVGCCVCRRIGNGFTPAQVHHIASGSSLRSDFSVAPLCHEHHTGPTGLHGMGVKKFIVMYRLPGESEYGLLVWVNEDIAKHLLNIGAKR